MECLHCGKVARPDDRVGDWWGYNGGYLCLECTNRHLGKESKPQPHLKPEHAPYTELRERLVAIQERAIKQEKFLKEEHPKFTCPHAQPTTEREYGAFWSLDILYWIQDYCAGFIDDD